MRFSAESSHLVPKVDCLKPVKPRIELEEDFREALLQVWTKKLFVILKVVPPSGLRSDIWGVQLNIFAPFNLHNSSVAAYQGNDVYAVPKPRLLNSFIPISMTIRKAQPCAGVVCSTVREGA